MVTVKLCDLNNKATIFLLSLGCFYLVRSQNFHKYAQICKGTFSHCKVGLFYDTRWHKAKCKIIFSIPSVSSRSTISILRIRCFSFSLNSAKGPAPDVRFAFCLHKMTKPSKRKTCLSAHRRPACFERTPSEIKLIHKIYIRV